MDNLIFYILLAFIAGISLGINRSILGIIGSRHGAMEASVLNHFSGALFLAFIIFVFSLPLHVQLLKLPPFYSFFGGAIGALFVILTSYVIPKIGVLNTSAFLISGQVICSNLIDLIRGISKSIPLAILGISLILLGLFIGRYRPIKE